MYRRRGRSEFELAVKKFLEHGRDPGRRLKALRHAEEKATQPLDVKELYMKHSSVIFFIFYSYFGSLESAILERANKGRGYSELHLRELRETALPALEKIIIHLPELIHRRFQYNSICLIIRKLLHPDNVLKLRKDGLRLLILWLQALQNSAGDASMQLFASAVPYFPPQKTPLGLPTPSHSSSSSSSLHPHLSTHSLVERYGTYSSRDGAGLLSRRASSASVGLREVVKVASLQPLHRMVYSGPVTAADHDATLALINHLMDCLTDQVGRLHWADPSQGHSGFAFLFFLFKLFYLACLFKNFRTEAGLYSQTPPPEINVSFELRGKLRTLDALEEESSLDQGTRPKSSSATPPSASASHSPSLRDKKRLHRTGGYRMSQVIKLDYDLSNPVYDEVKTVILARVLTWVHPSQKKASDTAPPPSPSSPIFPTPSSHLPPDPEGMARMLFASRDNVSLLCEVMRQGLQGSLAHPQLARRVVELYWGWVEGGKAPPFMMPPLAGGGFLGVPGDAAQPTQPWEEIINYEGHDSTEVGVGLQPALKMMIHHTSLVFLLPERGETRREQLVLCRRMLRFYQDTVMTWRLDHYTWEYLLAVLLYLTLELLRGESPADKESSLAGSLATMLLKTLLLCYLRASMVTNVSSQLWDSLCNVLSSLTHWKEVIDNWKFVLDTMTHILAQTVYGLDLIDLPLQRLLREESMIGGKRIARTPSAAPSELNTTNLNSFADVKSSANISGIQPCRVATHSAEQRRMIAMKNKSQTVDLTPSSTDVPPARERYISIPAEGRDSYSLSINTAAVGGGEGAGPPPARSSSNGNYKPLTEEEEEEKCPTISLPAVAEFAAESEGPVKSPRPLQRSQRVEEREESSVGHQRGGLEGHLVIDEQRMHSPTPEGDSLQSPGPFFERGGSVEPLIETSEKPREKTRRSLFGRGRNRSESSLGGAGGGEREGRSRRKSAAAKIDRDLVFANESSDESVTLLQKEEEGEEEGGGGAGEMAEGTDGGRGVRVPQSKKAVPSSPLTASWTTGERERQRGFSQSAVAAGEGEEEEEEGASHGRVYKSSSEGNLRQLSLLSEAGEEDENGEEREDTRSVVGTPATIRHKDRTSLSGSRRKMGVVFSPQDAFSSAIIPSSQARLLSSPVGPRSQSPALSPVHPPSLPSPHSTPITLHTRDTEGGTTGVVAAASEEESVKRSEVATYDPQRRTPSPTNTLTPSFPHHTQGGWSEVVGAVVWQRIVKVLGDINKIPEPAMHHLAFQTLLSVWRRLEELDANLGVSTDNQTTPPLPPYLPPLLFFLPWVLKACTLGQEYLPGRTVAVQLLCEMNIRHCRTPHPPEQLAVFYLLLQRSLQPSSDTLYVAVRYCCQLYSHGLPGAGVLLADCITACSTILSSRTRGTEVPRSESLQLLGSMLFLPHLSPDLRQQLVSTLLTAARSEPSRNTRCTGLHLVGMMVFLELFAGQPSTHISEAVDILLASLTFPERSVAMTAIDTLTLLTEVAPQMQASLPATPARILRSICHSLSQFMTHPELKRAAWVTKVVVSLLLCLRDWMMVLPLQKMVEEAQLSPSILQEAFKVLQAAATSCERAQLTPSSIATQVAVKLDPLDSNTTHNMSPGGTARGHKPGQSVKGPVHPPHAAAAVRPFSQEDEARIQVAAKSVLTHLMNLVGHFPLDGGPAQMTSVVSEYHDSPSLRHLDDLSTEIFDSPRVQVFSLNDSAVVTLVEIPIQDTGLPVAVEHSKYHTRVIVRDVTGKYCWDCATLYGPQMFPQPDGIPQVVMAAGSEESLSTATADSASLEVGGVGGVASSDPFSEDPLQPPSWESHSSGDRDTLEELLKHIESTSPECVLYPGVAGLDEPAPVASKTARSLEGKMVAAVQTQSAAEAAYAQGISRLASVCGEREEAPTYISVEFAYHHCRLLLSHLGWFSANRRDHLDLLERNNQLILELRNMDSTPAQSRMTYKVAVLYVAPGQEDKQSVLTNSSGSRDFEEFVSGLGWEVNMETHAGYMGGLKREFCSNTTLPYYATSSEEVLFHVSTRMPSKGSDVEQKVRHLGNDEVHIVWSEHWRDYRRTIFKTAFADILIVIYPLTNGLFRIELIKKQKQNVLFGPLFDGAVVNRKSLPSLVRATAVNALRAQRSPLVGARARYEDRLKYIQTIVRRKMKSSFEEFAQNVMHPLESSSPVPGSARVPMRNQAPELEPLPPPSLLKLRLGSHASSKTLSRLREAESYLLQRWSQSPQSGILLVGDSAPLAWSSSYMRRSRANTNEDRRPRHAKSGPELQRQRLPRNHSVPEKLHRIHQTEGGAGETTPPPSPLSASGTNLALPRRPINIRRHRTASPSPTSQAPPELSPYRSDTS